MVPLRSPAEQSRNHITAKQRSWRLKITVWSLIIVQHHSKPCTTSLLSSGLINDSQFTLKLLKPEAVDNATKQLSIPVPCVISIQINQEPITKACLAHCPASLSLISPYMFWSFVVGEVKTGMLVSSPARKGGLVVSDDQNRCHF